MYWLSVNCTDGQGWKNETYWFTTVDEQDYGNLGSGSNQNSNPVTNNPPNTPTTPNGTTLGYVNTTYEYSTNTTDLDNDQVKFRFDWGDGAISDWTELVESGSTVFLSHNWSSNETYYVKSHAKDEGGEESDWSETLTVTIQKQPSVIEEIEIVINIPKNMTIYQIVDFNCSILNNPDDENITYSWDFGDDTTGDGISPSHHYLTSGTYTVSVTIYDSDGAVLAMTSFEIIVSAEGDFKPLKENENSESQENKISLLLLFGIIGGIITVLLVLFMKRIKNVFLKTGHNR